MPVGDRGTVLVTQDGGETWTPFRTNLRESLNSISFADEKNGVIVGSRGTILVTEDGGLSWRSEETPIDANLFAVTAFASRSAIAVGENGSVVVTSDGGRTWQSQLGVTNKLLQAVVFRGGKNLWVGGSGGAILKRTENLSPSGLQSPRVPPILRDGTRTRPVLRQPLVPVTDDGDIEPARRPAEP